MVDRRIIEIPLDLIDIGHNVRTKPPAEAVLDMAETLSHGEFEQPITVRPNGDRYTIITGQIRYLAAKAAGKQTITAIVDDRDLSSADIVRAQIIENIQRTSLPEIDTAKGIEQLIRETGCTASHVAEELGLRESRVSGLRSLLTLPAAVQDQVERGELAASTAMEIARAPDAETQLQLAAEVTSRGLTRDAVVARIKRGKRDDSVPAASPASRATACLAKGRSVTVAGPSLTMDSFIEWLEEVLAKARKARPQGVTIKTFCRVLKEQATS